jgi:hypothetical protein
LALTVHVMGQGKGNGGNRSAKENTAPTDTRDKVGIPDPGMDIFGLRLLPKAQSKESLNRLCCVTDSSDAERRF